MAVLDREKIISQSVYSKEGLTHALWRCHFFGVPPKWEFIMPHFRQTKQNEKPFLLGNMIPELRIWLVLSSLNFV